MEKFKRKSRITGEYYYLFESVRILNLKQVTAYIDHGVMPLDIYTSKDNDGKPVLVFLFDREETKEVYDLWCKHEL